MPDDTRKQSILIVDDNPNNLKLLADAIADVGYTLRFAQTGSAALKSVEAQPPDLILLDIRMPGMDGFEVCERLKSDRSFQDIPVLFISALTQTEEKVKAFRAGGVDYIAKPIQAEEVVARVKTHLAIRRYQLELEEKSRTLQDALEELRAAQDQLVHAEKMASLGVLAAGIAHEINNPINFIKTSVHALGEDMKDVLRLLHSYDECCRNCDHADTAEPIQEVKPTIEYDTLVDEVPTLVKNITVGVERAEEIINSLRIYASPESEKRIPTNVNEIIDSALTMLYNRYKNRLTVTREFGEIPLVNAQPGRLIQVFSNIIGNAIDALHDAEAADGHIAITTSLVQRDGVEQVEAVFTDNGCGMSDEIRDKVFDPFFTTKPTGEGVGLGMSISYGIIRDHQGGIEIDSSAGSGTKVLVYLPTEQGGA